MRRAAVAALFFVLYGGEKLASVNIAAIKDATINRSKKIIQSEVKMSFSELKQHAELFLQDVLTIYRSGEIERKHSNGDIQLMRLWSIYRDANTSRALSLIQNSFALALDNYLERKIILTYVGEDGRIYLYTEEGEMKLLERVGKNAGRANFANGAWTKKPKKEEIPLQYSEFMYEEEDLVSKINRSADQRKAVYAEGIKRWNLNQQWHKGKQQEDKSNKQKYYYNDKTPIYYPEESFSKGRLGEAYVEAVIQNRDGDMIGEMNNALKQLYQHIEKDTVGAIVKGDVVASEDGKISLAVKAKSASTAKIGQYIVAADKIRQMEAPPEEGIQKWLETLPTINAYAKEIEESAKNKVEDVLFNQLFKS